jgi:hypothetical protein
MAVESTKTKKGTPVPSVEADIQSLKPFWWQLYPSVSKGHLRSPHQSVLPHSVIGSSQPALDRGSWSEISPTEVQMSRLLTEEAILTRQ